MSGRQKLLSLELPNVARQADLCIDFAGLCGGWVDSGHGYAAACDWDAVRDYKVTGSNSYSKMVARYRQDLLALHAASEATQ